MFVDVLLKFGNQPRVFEESSGFRQTVQDINGSFGTSQIQVPSQVSVNVNRDLLSDDVRRAQR